MSEGDMGIVFLDRDGTINIDHGYVTSAEHIDLIPGAAAAIGALQRGGFKVIIVSNQSAIGRGMATAQDVEECNAELCRQLLAEDADAKIDLVVYSPDAPENAGDTRKPGIGLLREVEKHWTVEAKNSWMIGDKASDINFGLNAGFPIEQCLLVLSGKGEATKASWKGVENLRTFDSLLEAAHHIVTVS
jgi:D,D-heptose 1,7-bisphosphate phosphatase